ncbi:MAG: MarR family winged helix-turn-helix transcriptional regulator [Spirochaetaceae bacterium]
MVISDTEHTGTGQIGASVSILYRHGTAHLSGELKRYGLGAGQHAILLIISDTDGLRQEDLVRVLHVDKAHVARSVQKLLELDYVRKEDDPTDQRARTLHATEKARQIIPAIHSALEAWNNIVMIDMSPEERDTLVKLLGRAASNAERNRA